MEKPKRHSASHSVKNPAQIPTINYHGWALDLLLGLMLGAVAASGTGYGVTQLYDIKVPATFAVCLVTEGLLIATIVACFRWFARRAYHVDRLTLHQNEQAEMMQGLATVIATQARMIVAHLKLIQSVASGELAGEIEAIPISVLPGEVTKEVFRETLTRLRDAEKDPVK